MRNWDEEENEAQEDQKSVQVVPSVCEEILRANSDDPDDEFNHEDPHKDIVNNDGNCEDVIDQKDGVDECGDDEKRDDEFKGHVMNNFFEFKSGVEEFPEIEPTLDVVEGRRDHGTVFEDDGPHLHELVDLLDQAKVTTERLLFSSVFMHMSVMNSTYLIL